MRQTKPQYVSIPREPSSSPSALTPSNERVRCTRSNYQFGCLQRKKRENGPDVWVLRYRKQLPDGTRRLVSPRLGTIEQYPNRALALRAADAIRLQINAGKRHSRPITLGALIELYEREEMPERPSTRQMYHSLLRHHIAPRWGDLPISDVKPIAVEQWLKGLRCLPTRKDVAIRGSLFPEMARIPAVMSPPSRAQIKFVMHKLFELAMRWDLLPCERNPMSLIRIKESSKPQKERRALSLQQCQLLLAELRHEPARTLVIVGLALGLRCGELFALKWNAFDWKELRVEIRLNVSGKYVGDVKTPASRGWLPVEPAIAEILSAWRQQTPYAADSDWVFASPYRLGKSPLCPHDIMRRFLAPAALRAGVGPISWHVLRHTNATLLDSLGAREKVQQQLLRWADPKMANRYTHRVPDDLRKAHAKLVRALLAIPKVKKAA